MDLGGLAATAAGAAVMGVLTTTNGSDSADAAAALNRGGVSHEPRVFLERADGRSSAIHIRGFDKRRPMMS